MSRRFGPWCENIAASFGLLAVLAAPALADPMAQGAGAGTSAAATVTERFGTRGALQKNLLDPMTSPAGAPLRTLDGSQAFTAPLSSPNSQQFLDVLVQPQGTGDLGLVRIGQDTDFNGTIDYSYTIPALVSGVCGNGVISCDPGTWNNCRHYRWTAGVDAKVALEGGPGGTITPLDLGGCYCINNGCGTNLAWANTDAILRSLGGGAVGAIQAANPGYQISDVRATPVSITYFGQDVTRTADPTGHATTPAAPLHQVTLYRNPAAIAGAATATVAAQSGQADSLYSLVRTLSDRAGGSGERRTCGVTRVIEIVNRSDFCQEPLPTNALPEGMAETTTYYRVRTGDARSRNDCQCGRTVEGCPPVTGAALTAGAPAGSQFFGTGAEGFWGRKKRSGVDACSYGVHDYYALCLRQYDLAAESIQDGCQALDADPDCAQWEETIDGVRVFENFNPTGLAPLPSTRTFAGVSLHPVERDWWVRQRAYLCKTSAAPADLGAAATRFGHVVSSLDDAEGATARYEDRRLGSGVGGSQQWILEAGSFDTGALGGAAAEECELACRTQRATEDYQAGVAGVAAQMQTDPRRFDVIYHACRNGVCPAGPDETIVQDCACLNEFTQAALMMQTMRLAGQDTICTSGTPQPIPPTPAAAPAAAP